MNLVILVEKEFKETVQGLGTLHEVRTWFETEPFENFFDLADRILMGPDAYPDSKIHVMYYENLFDWIDTNTDLSNMFYIYLPMPSETMSQQTYVTRTKSILEKLEAKGHPNKSLLINP